MAMNEIELKRKVEKFLFEYADCLNEKRYELFANFFSEENCHYEIQSKENEDLGLTTPIMGCYSHGMVRDRVAQLIDNTLTYHRLNLRHFISNITIDWDGKYSIDLKANFQVMQSDLEGVTSLYLVGRYDDKLIMIDGSFKFVSKRAILDSFSVPNMLAVPV